MLAGADLLSGRSRTYWADLGEADRDRYLAAARDLLAACETGGAPEPEAGAESEACRLAAVLGRQEAELARLRPQAEAAGEYHRRASELEAERDELRGERDRARNTAVTLEQELAQAEAERDQYASAIRHLTWRVRQTAYIWSQTLPETIPTADVVTALGGLCSLVPPPPEGLRDDLWQRIVGAYYVRFENDGHPEDSQAAADEAMAIVQPELDRLRGQRDRARRWAVALENELARAEDQARVAKEQARIAAVAALRLQQQTPDAAQRTLDRIRAARTWTEVWVQLGMYYGLTPEECGVEARARRTGGVIQNLADAEQRVRAANRRAEQAEAEAQRLAGELGARDAELELLRPQAEAAGDYHRQAGELEVERDRARRAVTAECDAMEEAMAAGHASLSRLREHIDRIRAVLNCEQPEDDVLPVRPCERADQHGYHMWPGRPGGPALCPGTDAAQPDDEGSER